MQRSALVRFGLALGAVAVLAGCAGRPGRQPYQGSSLATPNGGGMPVGSTTGDWDRCAYALGNPTGNSRPEQQRNAGGTEVTANGIIIGNVALVALPRLQEAVPLTNAERFGVGGMIENNGVSALDRVFMSCKAQEIRVVEGEADRQKLAHLIIAVRKGQPATNFLADFADLNSRARTAHGQNLSWPPGPVGVPGNGNNTEVTPAVPGGAGGAGAPLNESLPAQPVPGQPGY